MKVCERCKQFEVALTEMQARQLRQNVRLHNLRSLIKQALDDDIRMRDLPYEALDSGSGINARARGE